MGDELKQWEFIDKNWVKRCRQKCQVITRVMGYLRWVENYNIGKKSEFYSRKYFIEWKWEPRKITDAIQTNRDFVAKYS